MSIEFITVSLNHGNCYVGTVSCDTLQVSQQIVECESLLEFTGSILQTTDVAGLQFVAKNTDQLAQRLYLLRHDQGDGTEGEYRRDGIFPDGRG